MQKLLMMQLTTTAMPVIPTKPAHGTRPVLSLRNQGFDAVFPNQIHAQAPVKLALPKGFKNQLILSGCNQHNKLTRNDSW
jgi:hypothetical protein